MQVCFFIYLKGAGNISVPEVSIIHFFEDKTYDNSNNMKYYISNNKNNKCNNNNKIRISKNKNINNNSSNSNNNSNNNNISTNIVRTV